VSATLENWSVATQNAQNSSVVHNALANRLNRLVTATFAAAVHDEAAVRVRVKRVLRGIRRRRSCSFPYVVVDEVHPAGHGLHCHFLVAGETARDVEMAWT